MGEEYYNNYIVIIIYNICLACKLCRDENLCFHLYSLKGNESYITDYNKGKGGDNLKAYNDESIKVLSDIDHIRTRPTMYISTERPSYQMWTEIADNAVDEAMNGYADRIIFTVDYDNNYIAVTDNGRGLPQGMNKDLNKPTIFAIYQKLNAGGKYDQDSYAMSGGLNGVGSTVVNALSKDLKVETWRGNDVVNVEFQYGQEVDYNKGKCNKMSTKSGTRVMYHIDTDHPLFTDSLKDYETDIINKVSLLKTLMPRVKIIYNGEEVKARDFREFLHLSNEPLLDESILITTKDYSVALNWSKDTNKSTQVSYCNSIFTPNGGDHVKGVESAITSIFGSDGVYGLNMALSINYPKVEYDSQAKTKAVSKDMRAYLSESAANELKSYLRKNPEVKEAISNLISYKRNEMNKRNNKSNVKRNRKDTFLSSLGVTGFADCNTKNRELAELYIVEGNSAAGSAIQARDVETQAIMPIRGKILNVLTADISSILKNREIATIYSNLDTGVFQDFDIRKSRYDKVIIFTDADEDGKNIASLLIALFITLSPELIEEGHLYLALPPLYGTYEKDKFTPINDEETKNSYLKKGYHITRYKGLGEMNPEQLRISCMDPETRNLIRIDMSNTCVDEVKKIMGSDTKYRRTLLERTGVLY